MSTTRFFPLFLVSLVVLGSTILAMQPTKSVNGGVYSTEQAARGEQIYKAKCGSCHYPAQFTGDDLFKAWADKPLSELFNMIRDSMPEDNPGTLPIQEYGDVVAFILQLNKYPTGTEELVASEEAMAAILFERPK